MGEPAVLMRPARPEFGEGLVFARYLDQAAEGFFSFMLGRNSEQIIARSFSEPGHSQSFEHVLFAERDGEVVGMASAFTSAQHDSFSEEPLKRAAGRKAALRLRCVRILLWPLFRVLNTVTDGDFYLLGLAVEPDLRGAGIGSLLMADTEDRARRAGSVRLCLDVAAKNEGARKLYARRGMVESSQWPAPKLLPTLFVRMTKDLSEPGPR